MGKIASWVLVLGFWMASLSILVVVPQPAKAPSVGEKAGAVWNLTSGSVNPSAATMHRITSAVLTADGNTLGLWHFDGSGQNEVSDNSNAIAVSSASFNSTGGKFGGYAYIPYSSDHVKIPYNENFDLPTSFTVEFWFRQRENRSFAQNLVYKGTATNYYNFYVFRQLWNEYNYGPVIAGFTSSSTGYWKQVSNANELAHNVWHYVAYAKSTSGHAYYLDGELIYSDSITDSAVTPATDIIIGDSAVDTDIDELRISNIARTATTIQNYYYSQVGWPPTASFTWSPTSPTTSDTVQFTDTSTDSDGTIVSWSWDFGDYTTSSLQNPTHQYSSWSGGWYTVNLTVTDNDGHTDGTWQSIYVTVVSENVPTTLSMSPSSFTLGSGSSTTLTATLKDNADNALANKPITWSASSGSVSPSSLQTTSAGQVSVTYTAPSVTAQTSVTITASFVGDENYQASGENSFGTITPAENVPENVLPTTLSVSPSSFTLQSGGSTTLTATLRDNGNNPLAGKTIAWSATSGSVSPEVTANSSGQVTVTYTAPSVTTQTSVTVTASFGGDNQYQSSSGTSSGTINPAENAENVAPVAPASTSLSISPSSFTLQSNNTTTLTATLTSGGSALTNKTIAWSASSGGVSPSSGTTNSWGQTSVTYTAPSVTAQTSVTVTASFAGDTTYSGSNGTSTGTISAVALTSTSLEVSPTSFDVSSGELVDIVAMLFDGSYNRLAGKTVSWSATDGNVTPSENVTDSQGQIKTTYTAPTVDHQTSIMIVASFAGDNAYASSTTICRGTVLPQEVVESAAENLENSLERLEFAIEELAEELQAVRNAISAGWVGACMSIEMGAENTQIETEFQHSEVEVDVKEVSVGDKIEVDVSSEITSGRTVVLNIDNSVLPILSAEIKVLYDNEEIVMADNYDDVLDPTDENVSEYLILTGAKGAQVLVSVPQFSTHTITISTVAAAPSAQLPTQPFVTAPPLWVILIAVLALIGVLVAVIWRYLSVGGKGVEKFFKREKARPRRLLKREKGVTEKEKGPPKKAREEDPLKILKLRLARGEITKKEYEEMKKALEE